MDQEDGLPDQTATSTDRTTLPIRADWQTFDSPCRAISETVATVTGREPADLPPVSESIDLNAMMAIVAGSASRETHVRVSFAYAGFDVTLGGDGELELRTEQPTPRDSSPSPQTDSELAARLERLLNEAVRNGISICGGWAVRNSPELPDWDIHITQVTKPDDGGARGR